MHLYALLTVLHWVLQWTVLCFNLQITKLNYTVLHFTKYFCTVKYAVQWNVLNSSVLCTVPYTDVQLTVTTVQWTVLYTTVQVTVVHYKKQSVVLLSCVLYSAVKYFA